MQRVVDRSVRVISRPRFVAILSAIIVAWMVLNIGSANLGYRVDPPPFQILQGVGGALAIYLTVLILITQRRENELAVRSEQLTLQLAILSEKKNAKIIQLLEELRRDSPMVSNRIDPEADALAVPADTHMVAEALRDSDEDPLAEPPPLASEQSTASGAIDISAPSAGPHRQHRLDHRVHLAPFSGPLRVEVLRCLATVDNG